jgi:hypothetical protein
MTKRPAIVTQTEIKRTVKAMVDAGVEVGRVEVDYKVGKIVVFAGKPGEYTVEANDLDAWIAKHADAAQGH